MFIRPLPGVVREWDRMVHVAPVPHPESKADFVTTHCGLRFSPTTAELLTEILGMPCERCLARALLPADRLSVRRGAAISAREQLRAIGT